MATNFQDRFDAAIKRPGRFDLLLCMGPPTLKDKLDRLHIACSLDVADPQTTKAGSCIKEYLKDSPDLEDQLALFTFGEYKSFLKTFGAKNTIGDEIERLGQPKFCERLKDYNQYVTLKLDDLSALSKIGVKWNRLAELDKKPFSLKQLENEIKGYQPTAIIRYLCDRKESRDQS
jgi:SpoVK/Ycf46/Vps4 family AAA+-type ATPase